MSRNFHVISPLSWVQSAFRDYFNKSHMTDSSHPRTDAIGDIPDYAVDAWNLSCDYGFEPTQDLADGDALWITPDLLIALNGWRHRLGMQPLAFEAPPAGWLSSLPLELTGRQAVCATVAQIRQWEKFPKELGEQPWSQLGNGRVSEFRAARRTLAQLQHDLLNAPDASLISVNAHVAAIAEEWCVIIHHGEAVAASGYCVHLSGGNEDSEQADESRDILTVFDGAKFHDEYRPAAETAATAAAQASHLSNASIIVGFHSASPTGMVGNTNQAVERQPVAAPAAQALISTKETAFQSSAVIIEAAPVWCTTPYPYLSNREITGFLEAVADSCIRRESNESGQEGNQQDIKSGTDGIYLPDPWMIQHNVHRYDRF